MRPEDIAFLALMTGIVALSMGQGPAAKIAGASCVVAAVFGSVALAILKP